MRFEEYIIVAALGAGILSKHNRRQAALAFGYAIIVAAFTWLFPSPMVFEKVGYDWWYVCWRIHPNFRLTISRKVWTRRADGFTPCFQSRPRLVTKHRIA